MQSLMHHWRPQPAAVFYKKEPESSELGRRIVSDGLILMQEIGFEAFTFKKLAERLQTTEASVYRYFDNKHHLLLYFTSVYWLWLEYHLTFGIQNLTDNQLRLSKVIEMITQPEKLTWPLKGLSFSHMQALVVTEWGKVYYTSEIDAENKAGMFSDYKRFCQRMSSIISDAHPDYPYPYTLVTAVMNILFVQRFYASHLPTLTEISHNDTRLTEFLQSIVVGALNARTV
jgi:AcrR family transcriptional regulator